MAQWSMRYAYAKFAQAMDVHSAMMRKQMEKFASAEIPTAVQANEMASRVSAAVSTGKQSVTCCLSSLLVPSVLLVSKSPNGYHVSSYTVGACCLLSIAAFKVPLCFVLSPFLLVLSTAHLLRHT